MNAVIGTLLIMLGLLAVAAGAGFILQSRGLLGPESSFMVENRDWTGYGLVIVLGGVLSLIAGQRLSR